jgi:hypothetical protein
MPRVGWASARGLVPELRAGQRAKLQLRRKCAKNSSKLLSSVDNPSVCMLVSTAGERYVHTDMLPSHRYIYTCG